jgi:hypothetical protein
MKLVIALLFSTLSYSLFACTQEAQFIGKVSGHRRSVNNVCLFKVDSFSWFGPSVICPLVEGEVSGYEFNDKECALKEGESISGVFIKNDNQIEIY